MTIPIPNLSVIGLALIIAAFTVVSRVVTTFTPLYFLRQGLRDSLLPAINLAQISEFSLVVIQTGVAAGMAYQDSDRKCRVVRVCGAGGAEHLRHRSQRSDYARVDRFSETCRAARSRSQPCGRGEEDGHGEGRRNPDPWIFRAASALLSEIERQNPGLLDQIGVVDFNPVGVQTLKGRGIHVTYGDISNVDTLVHAGVARPRSSS